LTLAAPPSGVGITPSLDMATSVVAVGRVRTAADESKRLPDGRAIGSDGEPTNDPGVALGGSVLPMGGYKGFALAFMLDVFTACLTDAKISPDISGDPDSPGPQKAGYLMIAIHLPTVDDRGAYRSRLDTLIHRVHDAPRAPGVPPFLIPGEIEFENERVRCDGIPLRPATHRMHRNLGAEFG
jgi:LDH2 family malate/lactate/ureidoglycolate dehydrogenase